MTPKQLAKFFPLGPDSLPQPGVPRGRVEARTLDSSRVFPGTVRDYWVYVPAQYRASRPACVLVVQDGHAHLFGGRWNLAVVLDNLIHQRAMPVTIGVFINPGKVPAARAGGAERDNRSLEYDTPGDRYARFVLEEILPEVARDYLLRTDGNSRAIFGGSSGGMCALNAAWSRPDAFQRVVSEVGSFTPMRGGHDFAAQVRLTAPKPLKVFLQGGADDLDVVNGHWWTANLEMLAALSYAGYDVNHVWHERAGHNEYHCNMVAPDALRWVWSDYPKQPVAGRGSKQPIAQLLAPQKNWREGTRIKPAERAPNRVVTKEGCTYVAEMARNRVVLIEGRSAPRVVAKLSKPMALALTPDEAQLVIATSEGSDTRMAVITADGGLVSVEPYFRRINDAASPAGNNVAIAMAKPGWLITATEHSIQFNNSNGLPSGIMPAPGAGPITDLWLGGPKRDVLWVACGGRWYHRRLRLIESLWC
ncbi:MAG: alpha/beta hydrolase-fold protein [Cephaloticoccus sp.]